MGWSHIHMDKNSGRIPQERGVPHPQEAPPAQSSNARMLSSHNCWLQKPVGIESVEEAAGALSSSCWGTHIQTHLLRLTTSELQHRGGSLKGTSDI